MTSPIQLFVPKFRIDETLEQIRECLEKGWTGLGFKTVEFEERWRDYTGLPYAHFLNSATSGLHLAVGMLKAHDGWQDGDEAKCNMSLTGLNRSSAVGLFPNGATPEGVLDLTGNVLEWCLTRSDGDGRGISNDPDALGQRVLRGGAYNFTAAQLALSNSYWGEPGIAPQNIGFRVCLSHKHPRQL